MSSSKRKLDLSGGNRDRKRSCSLTDSSLTDLSDDDFGVSNLFNQAQGSDMLRFSDEMLLKELVSALTLIIITLSLSSETQNTLKIVP